MLIDGAPSGAGLMDQYLFKRVGLGNLYSTKMAGRITQLLGRIIPFPYQIDFAMYGNDVMDLTSAGLRSM